MSNRHTDDKKHEVEDKDKAEEGGDDCGDAAENEEDDDERPHEGDDYAHTDEDGTNGTSNDAHPPHRACFSMSAQFNAK